MCSKLLLYTITFIAIFCNPIDGMETKPLLKLNAPLFLNKGLTHKALELVANYQKSLNKEESEAFLSTNLNHISGLFISCYLDEPDESSLDKLYEQIKSSPLLKQGIATTINIPNNMGETRLHQAKTEDEAKKLIKLGASLYLKSKLHREPFTSALVNCRPNVARVILDAMGTEPLLSRDLTKFTNLHYALIAGDEKIVIRILDNVENAKFFPHRLNKQKEDNPLHLAALYCPKAIEPLIDKGADVTITIKDTDECPFLTAACKQGPEVLEIFVKHGVNPSKKSEGINAIHYAVYGRNPYLEEVLNYLVVIHKVDINEPPAHTPLAFSLTRLPSKEAEKMILKLLKFGANPNLYSTNLNKALTFGYALTEFLKNYISFKSDKIDIISYDVDVNYLTKQGNYPLATAILTSNEINGVETNYGPIRAELNYEIIRYLIQKGAKITQSHKDLILKDSDDEKLINLIQNAPIFNLENKEA